MTLEKALALAEEMAKDPRRDCLEDEMIQVFAKSIRLVQGHAKRALDGLPARWNAGFQAGLKQAIPYEKELTDALAEERKARQDDNATLTADILRLEEALQQCVDWAAAYPVDIFPQPTPEQVDAVCKTLGFRIDSISAMVLRNYTGRIGEIARGALAR